MHEDGHKLWLDRKTGKADTEVKDTNIYIYIYIYIRACVSCIHAYIAHINPHTYKHYIRFMHTCTHTPHAYINTYMHICITSHASTEARKIKHVRHNHNCTHPSTLYTYMIHIQHAHTHRHAYVQTCTRRVYHTYVHACTDA